MIYNEYNSLELLEDGLCKLISKNIKQAIKTNGIAKILLSGGSTPKGLYQKLSKLDLAWEKVVVALVDDRFVPINNVFSNHKLITENLLINKASNTRFIGMVYDKNAEINIELVEEMYHILDANIDVTLLGMGSDGHTASLFPNDPASEKALSLAFKKPVLNTIADVDPKNRITCSKWFLHQSKDIYLMFSGSQKLKVLQSAESNRLPIAHFFKTEKTELSIHYNL